MSSQPRVSLLARIVKQFYKLYEKGLLKKIFYWSLGLVVVMDVLSHRHHPHFFWDKIPGFTAVYALVGGVILAVASKWIGHAILMKREDYYDD